jgi:hypothetical protein
LTRRARTSAVREAIALTVNDRVNRIWLGLAGLLIAAGINVAVHEGWFVSVLIACIAVGGMCAPLLTWGGAAKALTYSEPKAVAELHATIRGEITR